MHSNKVIRRHRQPADPQVLVDIDEAHKVLDKLAKRHAKDDQGITEVKVFVDGNTTMVLLNGQYAGWSKFNPQDVTYKRVQNKYGEVIRYDPVSQYNPVVGYKKALYRAICKMLNIQP